MTPLFIPSILAHNWDRLTVLCGIVLAAWVLMILACIVDLWTGLKKAKALGEAPQSKKFRKTVSKAGSYWGVLLLAFFIDIMASVFTFYTWPFATIIIDIACIVIEGKSMLENHKAMKSNAADLMQAAIDIMECTTLDGAKAIVKKIRKEVELPAKE